MRKKHEKHEIMSIFFHWTEMGRAFLEKIFLQKS